MSDDRILIVSPLIAATYPPTSPETCCRRHAWCLREQHEDGPCVVVEQRALERNTFGPEATGRRWGR